MERKNFFTSGWLFLVIAIVNLVIATIFSPLITDLPRHFDEWLVPLIFLIPLSVAIAIISIFIPRNKIGVKRLLTIIFAGLAALLYTAAFIAIWAYWA